MSLCLLDVSSVRVFFNAAHTLLAVSCVVTMRTHVLPTTASWLSLRRLRLDPFIQRNAAIIPVILANLKISILIVIVAEVLVSIAVVHPIVVVVVVQRVPALGLSLLGLQFLDVLLADALLLRLLCLLLSDDAGDGCQGEVLTDNTVVTFHGIDHLVDI